MLQRWTRWVLLVATAGVGAALLVSSLIATQGSGPAAASTEFTIDILADGFNPPSCQVNRNGRRVTFHNDDSVPRRIVSVAINPDQSPLWDTGYLDPDETWGAGLAIEFQAQIYYIDADNPDLQGVIIAPMSNDAPDICTPLPPTPTPTNTFTPSPTLSATVEPATPTPQQPPRCVGASGCAVAPDIAKEEEPPTPEPTPTPTESPTPTSTPNSDTGPVQATRR